jgi:osmotically-inducible protein OsmY
MAPTADNDARSQAAHAAEARESRTGATETQTTDRDPQAVVERGHEDSTALDQGGHAADLAIAGKIKQAVADDDQLSFSARNVKISAEQGEVTLRGYVRSDTEKRVIAAYAQQVVGAGHVHNELEATR